MSKPKGLPKHQLKILKSLVGQRIMYNGHEWKVEMYQDNASDKTIQVQTHTRLFIFKYSQVDEFLESIIKITTTNDAEKTQTGNDNAQD